MSGAQRLSQFPGLLIMEQLGRTDPSRVHGLRWGRRSGLDSITRKESSAHPLREVEVKILIRSPVENTKYLWVEMMMSLATQTLRGYVRTHPKARVVHNSRITNDDRCCRAIKVSAQLS